MRLDDWIDPRHLDPAAQAVYAAAFATVPHASVAIDAFLRPEKLAALQRVFGIEGRFEERYFLDGRGSRQAEGTEEVVSAEAWRAAPDTRRASLERTFAGALPEHRMGHGIITQVKFLELMGLPEFMGFLEAVTGIRPAMLSGKMIRIMEGGHYIRPHNDAGGGRTLCAIFYVSPGWHPSFGGRFRHRGPGPDIVPVEPRSNRLLVFQARPDCPHDVEPIAAAGARWQRWAYTLWFNGAKATAA